MSRSEGLFLRQILNFRRSWAETPSPGYRALVEFPRVSVRVECRAARAGYRAAGEYLAVACSDRWPLFTPLLRQLQKSIHSIAKAASEKSLPEEGVKDDTERNNSGAEAEDQDIANIVSGNTRASLGCRDDSGSVHSIIRCHYGFPKRGGPRCLPEPLTVLSRTKAVCRSNHRSVGRVRDQPNSSQCFD
jgi:hypothetical protein